MEMNQISTEEVKRKYGLPIYISLYLSKISKDDEQKKHEFYERALDHLCCSTEDYSKAKKCLNHILGH